MKPLLPVLLLSCISCTAQVSFSVKAGAAISFLRNYKTYSTNVVDKGKVGPVIGLAADLKISEDLSLQPEVSYDQKGFKRSSYELTWHYLNVPLLLKARAYKNLFIEFGPSASFLLRANYVVTDNNFFQISPNQTGYYSRIYAGLNSGITYRYKKFEAAIRYSLDVTGLKLNEDYFDPEIDLSSVLPFGKHRVVQFTIGYELYKVKSNKNK